MNKHKNTCLMQIWSRECWNPRYIYNEERILALQIPSELSHRWSSIARLVENYPRIFAHTFMAIDTYICLCMSSSL